ncbi:MAG TPA: hypothetical protein VND64_35350, partial [Pirellulales bacterium]|nr:hypothetical protein [Pirellulales bacterium]
MDLSEAFVTPDIGVLLPNATGVLAEVKLSFPKDQAHWMDDFEQLMRYGGELQGWPSADGRVGVHDVVLITKQGRAVPVKKFYEARVGKEIVFERPFAIVSYNRSDERQKYYPNLFTTPARLHIRLDIILKGGVAVSQAQFAEKPPPFPHVQQGSWAA